MVFHHTEQRIITKRFCKENLISRSAIKPDICEVDRKIAEKIL